MNLDGLDAIIFDFDGVLVESVNVKTQAFGALYEKYGDDIAQQVEEYHLAHGGVSRFEKFRYYQEHVLGMPPLSAAAESDFADAFSTLVVDKVVAAPMVAGAQEFLIGANALLPLFVVSGTPTAELGEVIRRRDMQGFFDAIWGSPHSKTENIAELLHEHNLSAKNCLMIGDALADYVGATANDVPFLGRVARHDDNLFADHVTTFEDFSALPASWR